MCDEQGARFRDDTKVLAAIGTRVAAQTDRLTVRVPKALAEAAVAAWEHEENDAPGEETPERYALRDGAAELALIGLAITERGRWEGEEVAVGLDLASAGAAVRATR
ncbi:hypothetical protein [Streptomyces coeruleorubidus]|uniref:hypothetical protein n=1 Tax=Streptomyces coeruleorubidus TaxID=116188 RepID=UPI0033D851A4